MAVSGWRCLAELPEFTGRSTTVHGKLSYSNKDWVISKALFVRGEFEYEKIQKAIALAVEAGCISPKNQGYIIDVGANIGTVCITLVREGVFSAALAFEPEPRNHRLLVKNIRRNRLARSIEAFNYALSSAPGKLEMELSTHNFGDHRLRNQGAALEYGQMREFERSRITVGVHRLDDVLSALQIRPEEIKLLWMDVQGHEKHVVEGADLLLRCGVPVVAEFWPYGLARAGVSPSQFHACAIARFGHFYDLGEQVPRRRPIAELPEMFGRYRGATQFSDLLLLARQEQGQTAST
ncbi:MAG: hypothetical protein DMD82_13635 [Candidatus Rokuibacteriota bacterium]|nr:MAG: hypothetical protein DMD82_13635 [Candidatus Rokubacteria bacterium]